MSAERKDDLAAEVRRALRSQADDLPITDVPFDPTAPGLPGLERGDEDAPGVGRRRWATVAAAAAVVLAVGAGALVAADDDPPADRTGPGAEEPTTTVSIPDGAADAGPGSLPTPPDGMEAWSLRWGTTTVEQAPLAQLFEGRGTGARLLVVVHPDIMVSETTGLTVRGQPASAPPAPDVDDGSTVLEWEEGGARITAQYRGLAEDEVIAVLDGLRWRTATPAGGFANPTSGLLDLVVEAEGGPVEVRTTTVDYRDEISSVDEGEGEQLTVRAGVPIDHDGATLAGVTDRYHGTVDADGRATRFEPDLGILRRTDPDGSWVEVDANGTTHDEDALGEVADTVAEVDAVTLLTLRAEIEQRVGAEVPVVAEVPIAADGDDPAATVEHRADGEAEAVCLVVEGSARRCSGAGVEGLDVEGSFVVDERWYVVGVGRGAVTISAEPPRSSTRDWPALPGVRRGQADGWHAALAVVPADLDAVYTDAGSLRRPAV